MKATPDQVERVFLLFREGITRLQPLVKQTKLDREIVKAALRVVMDSEKAYYAACERNEKMDRLITFQRPIREQERGKSKGQVGASTNDRSPTPSGMPLYPFLAILTEKRSFNSCTLPAAQWTEPER